jgi:hypothetical protein
MTSHERSGFWRRVLAALGRGLRRAILGKSSCEYVKRFTGSDEYGDRAMAARLGWPQHQGARGPARGPLEPQYEPVYGWTRRQRDDYLARNPGRRSAYEAELDERRRGASPMDARRRSPAHLLPDGDGPILRLGTAGASGPRCLPEHETVEAPGSRSAIAARDDAPYSRTGHAPTGPDL